MATENSSLIRLRGTAEDHKILAELQQRLGLTLSAVIRLAVRRLYEQEMKLAKK